MRDSFDPSASEIETTTAEEGKTRKRPRPGERRLPGGRRDRDPRGRVAQCALRRRPLAPLQGHAGRRGGCRLPKGRRRRRDHLSRAGGALAAPAATLAGGWPRVLTRPFSHP